MEKIILKELPPNKYHPSTGILALWAGDELVDWETYSPGKGHVSVQNRETALEKIHNTSSLEFSKWPDQEVLVG